MVKQFEIIVEKHPDGYVAYPLGLKGLVEAIKARSEASKRIVEQLAVVGTFPDSVMALKSYRQLHREAPERALYVFHTSREALDITERSWLGIRGTR